MADPLVIKIKEAKQLLFDKLKTDLGDQIHVDMLEKGRIEDYKTNHQNGALVLHYDGSKLSDPAGRNIVHQNRDMRIAGLLQIRIEKGIGFRDDMIDAAIDSVSGIKIKAISKVDRVYASNDEYLTPEADESKQFYEHSILFIVPTEFQQIN